MPREDDWLMGALADQASYDPNNVPLPAPGPANWPEPLPPTGEGPTAHEVAAMRLRAPYRGRAEETQSNLPAIGDALMPKEPWQYGLAVAGGGPTLVGRTLAMLPRGVKMGALAAGFGLTAADAEADKFKALAGSGARAKALAGKVEAPAIIGRSGPTAEDIAAIRARAQEPKIDSEGVWSPRGPWPTAEREVFSTKPQDYEETTKIVPQVSVKGQLPGPLPGEKLPNAGRAEQIIANADQIGERIAERLYPLVKRQDPLLKFYHTAPVIRGLGQHADMTLAEANSLMRDWAGQGAATSPRTSTPPNLRNTSSLMYERAQGNPFTLERFKKEGNIPGYGMMGMHVGLGEKFAANAVNPWKNPKPFTFRENWSGNLADVTGDTHNIRGTLFEMDNLMPGQLHPSFFHGGEKGPAYAKYKKEGFRALDPGDINDSLGTTTVKKVERQSEYLPMVEPWYRAAKKLGIHPAEAQSGGWFEYGPITGLSSPPKTIVNLLNDQVADTAKTLNVSPEKVVEWWAQGKIPLTGVAGAMMGGLAAQDKYRQ